MARVKSNQTGAEINSRGWKIAMPVPQHCETPQPIAGGGMGGGEDPPDVGKPIATIIVRS